MNITVLVDFDNDSVATALEVAEALGPKTVGRAARHVARASSIARCSMRWVTFSPTGRQPAAGREGPRRAGRGRLSRTSGSSRRGGFNAERIREFEAAGVPVDAYGVGSSLIRGQNDFTADVVLLDGRPCAKVGRSYAPNPRLERVR